MKGKTILSLAIVLTMVLAAIPFAAVKAAAPLTVSVIFEETGTSTLTKASHSDFNVLVTIANVAAPGIDFFSIKMHWDPAIITLQHNDTTLDVLSGGFMPTFTGPSAAGTHYNTGTLDDVAGFDSSAYHTGSGTLFKMLMHDIADTSSNITIVAPNVDTYLMHTDTQVNIDLTVNGLATFTPPPATPPHAVITSPVDFSTVNVGDTVNLDGSHSTGGVDSVPASEPCPITVYDWTINNGSVFHLFGATASFVCSGPGLVTITLTVTAPDPTPGDSNYVSTDSATVHVVQLAVGTGRQIDVTTARGGTGPLMAYPVGWSDAYGPQEQVCIFAKVTYNGAPVEYKPVEFVVFDPLTGLEIASFTAFTNASGIATVCFRLPWQGSDAEKHFGVVRIIGTVDIAEVQISDEVDFNYGYILKINTVTVGGPYHKGDMITVDVTIGSIAMKDYSAFLQITASDELNVPIGQSLSTITVPAAGYNAMGLTIGIPSWAYVGTGTIYVDLLTSQTGVPYCPEKTTFFIIVYP